LRSETLDAAPAWVIDLLKANRGKRRDTRSTAPLAELDRPEAVKKAIEWLQQQAPEAVHGSRGITGYRVACRLRDMGLSQEVCLDLLLEHWESASLYGTDEDLPEKVDHAYRYATGAWGGALGVAEFEDTTTLPVEGGEAHPRFGQWVTPFNPAQIPKRAFVLGTFLAKGYVSGLVSPPGAGKTTLEITMAVALATGRADIVGMKVHGRHRVFLWNQEDELDELKRRLAAVMKAFDVTFDDLMLDGRPAIMLGSGADDALLMAKRGPTAIVASAAAKSLVQQFLEDGVSVAMFDPFVELHPADENSNVEIGQVGRVFRGIAIEAHAAVLLVHHTRKPPAGESTGHAGNMESARGAGSLVGVTRMGATLYGVDEKTAERFGIPEDERHRYVRFDDGKNNLALISSEPRFFKREGVNIGTPDDPEEVGVLRPVALGRRKGAAEQRAEDLAASVLSVMENTDMLPVFDVARGVVASDPLFADASADALRKVIKRLADDGKLSGFEIQERIFPNKKGRALALVRKGFEGSQESQDSAE